MLGFFFNAYSMLIAIGTFLQPFILLGIRLYWGWGFFQAGKSKLENMDPIIEYFGTLGISSFNAYIAAIIECAGGLCLMIGFATRLVAVPLIVTMVVALLTAHQEAVLNIFNDPETFTQQSPFSFLLAALIVFAFGPGGISVDGVIKKMMTKRS